MKRAGGVALAFADGPHPAGTRAVLAAEGAVATSFTVGERVRSAPELAAGVRAGDVLLLHDGDDYSAAGS